MGIQIWGKEMKNKLRFLRRRHTDTTLGMKAAKLKEDKAAGRPTVKEAMEWSKSFDSLLNDKYGLALFRGFLRTEFSEENLEFWIACEEYKKLRSKQQQIKAHEIYNDFVAVQAPKEINLDSKTRAFTISNMSNPNKHIFEQAQKRIQALMEKDSYPRFLRSEIYTSLTEGADNT